MMIATPDFFSLLSWGALAEAAPAETRVVMGAIGVLLILWGTRSKRLVAAAPGALVGLTAVALLLDAEPVKTQLLAGLVAAVAGAILGLMVQAIALRTAGALIGAIAVTAVFPLVSSQSVPPWWLPLAGALAGALVLPRLFSAAMRIMSPILGAMCLSFALGLKDEHQLYGILGFTIAGFALQMVLGKKAEEPDS
jgi:hypothetical protein